MGIFSADVFGGRRDQTLDALNQNNKSDTGQNEIQAYSNPDVMPFNLEPVFPASIVIVRGDRIQSVIMTLVVGYLIF
jgi:hypothetical protein